MRIVLCGICLLSQAALHAASISKADSTTALNLGGSWVGGVVPGVSDTMVVGLALTASRTAAIGAPMSVAGIDVANPNFAFTISASGSSALILGASGVAMNASANSLTVNAPVVLGSSQTWTGSSGAGAFNVAGALDLGGCTLTISNTASSKNYIKNDVDNGTINLTAGSSVQVSGTPVDIDWTANFIGAGGLDVRGSITISGLISFTGGVSVNGGATVVLTNTANNFGSVSIPGGRLKGATIADSGVPCTFGNATGNSAIAFGFGSTSCVLEYTGTTASSNRRFTHDARTPITGIDVTNAGTTLTISGSFTTGTQTPTGANGWVFNGNGNLVLSGPFNNHGTVSPAYNTSVSKTSGSGALTLSGSNTYAGGTTISTGTLLVNNSTGSGTGPGSVSISGATLGGNGTISGTTTFGTGGFLQPGAAVGDSLGRLSFSSALSLVNATTTLQISGTGVAGVNYDQVSVTGALICSGSLTISGLAGYQIMSTTATYTLFSFGSQSGDFAAVKVDGLDLIHSGALWIGVTGSRVLEFNQTTGVLTVGPIIVSQPVGVTVASGQSASLSVAATSVPAYQWRKDGAPISSATASTYAIAATAQADVGTYDVVLTYPGASGTSTAVKLSLGTPPAITTQPMPRTVGSNQSVLFTVVSPTATAFQWRKNGVNIGGATFASYTIASAQTADSGYYDVIVSNSTGACASVLAPLTVIAGFPSTSPINYFVDPNGVDTSSGMVDAPLQTLEKVRDQARALPRPLANGGVTIWLRGGQYVVNSTLALTSADSGNASAPIIYQPYPGETVSIRSGKAIPSASFRALAATDPEWNRLDSAARGRVYKASLAGLGLSSSTFRIASDGSFLPQSRYPDGAGSLGMVRIAAGGDGTAAVPARFEYAGNYPSRWTSSEIVPFGATLEGSWNRDWIVYKADFLGVDTTNCELSMKFGSPTNVDLQLGSKFSRIVDGMKAGFGSEKWWIWNLLEEITVPGEWAIDQRDKTLYIWLPDASPAALNQICVTDFAAPFVSMTGVTDVQIEGLEIGVGLGDGIQITDGARNVIRGNRIFDLAGNGIQVSGKSQGNHLIQSNDIYALSGIGIKVVDVGNRTTLVAAGLQVLNNHVYDVAGDGINLGVSIGITVAHNLIHHVGATGIGTGQGNEILIERNEIHHVGRVTSDIGLIYVFPRYSSRNFFIRNNYFHDDDQNKPVYIDNYGAGFTVEGNVFYKTLMVLAGNIGGLNNRVFNNLFIDTIGNSISMPLLDQTIRFNTVSDSSNGDLYWTAAAVAELHTLKYDQPPWSTQYPDFVNFLDYNRNTGAAVYNNAMVRSGSQSVSYSSLATFVDPANPYYIETHDNKWIGDKSTAGFMDVAALDFRLSPSSTIFTQIPGFQSIPFDQIGLQVDDWRTALPGAGVTGRYRYIDGSVSMTGAVTEDFAGTAVGTLPVGWDTVSGTPSVQDASGNHYLRSRAIGETNGGSRLTLADSLALDDIVTFQVKVKIEEAGVPGQNLVSLLTPSRFPALQLLCSGSGNINGIAGTTLIPGQWHQLKITVNVTSWKYALWFDGANVVTQGNLDGAPDLGGIGGLETEASLDDLAVDLTAYPTASTLTITPNTTSTSMVGLLLVGNYSYAQADGLPESGSTIRWMRTDNYYTDGQPIANATALSYTTTAADAEKYVYFEVTPRAGGINTGVPVVSGRFFVQDGGMLDLSNSKKEVVISGNLMLSGANTWTTGSWSILPTYWSQVVMKGLLSGSGSLTIAPQAGYPNRAVSFSKANTFSGGFTLEVGAIVYLGDPSSNGSSGGSSSASTAGSSGNITSAPLGTGAWTLKGGTLVPKGATTGAPSISILGDFQVGGDGFYSSYPNNRLTLASAFNLNGATRTITLRARRTFDTAMVSGGAYGALAFAANYGITPAISSGTLRLAALSPLSATECAVVSFTAGVTGFNFVNNAGLSIASDVYVVFGSTNNFIGAANTLPAVTVEAGGCFVLGTNGGNLDARRVNVSSLSGAGTVLTFDMIGGTGVLAINGGALGSTTVFSGRIVDTDTVIHPASNGKVSVEKSGSTTQVFSGINTYTGSTVVTGGTLKLGSTTALPSATALSIGVGATLDLGGFSATVQTFANAGQILNSGSTSATLTVVGNSQVLNVPPLAAPTVITHPAHARVILGSAATFTVVFGGEPVPTFQWQRKAAGTGTFSSLSNNASFSGVTTASLVVTGATLAMSGDEFRCAATNSQGSATSVSGVLGVARTAWHLVHFSALELATGGISADMADPDGDGISNLLEYAFDLDPKVNSAGLLPKSMLINNGTKLRLEFDRLRSDLNYTVQVSTDLIGWHDSPATDLDVQTSGQHVTATYTVGPHGRGYMRIGVVSISAQ